MMEKTEVPGFDRRGKAPESATKPKRKAQSPERDLNPEEEFQSAALTLIAGRWAEVWRTIPAAMADDDIEGVHDVRVASRRLRAAMDAAAYCFPERWYRRLHKQAKSITGALGAVRDRDVLIESLTAAREEAAGVERPGIDRLLARVERERTVARAEMEQFLVDLVESGLPGDVARRFGPAAAPTKLIDQLRTVVARETEERQR